MRRRTGTRGWGRAGADVRYKRAILNTSRLRRIGVNGGNITVYVIFTSCVFCCVAIDVANEIILSSFSCCIRNEVHMVVCHGAGAELDVVMVAVRGIIELQSGIVRID